VDFYEILDQVVELLRSRQRVTYRTLKRQFDLDDTALEDLKEELLFTHPEIVDTDGRGLVWAVETPPALQRIASMPRYLTEKILTSRGALEGERKQVTVLFADLKGSMELLADRDPEEARAMLAPVLERMMEAVHRYEGTVNQVMGDGIMALFGAPIAHEDHAVRACYAALHMQETMTRYGDAMQRAHGVPVQIRVGLHSGEVVVRGIDSSLHMDYTAVGQTTHLAARMEQMAKPGSVLVIAETMQLAEGHIQVRPIGPVAVKGLVAPVEVFELVGTGPTRTPLQAFAARGLTRFVGRQQETEALSQALGHAAAGHGQVVAVIGEPGVGKTRLCYECTHSPQTHGWLVLECRAVSYGQATPYLPVRELLKAYFQIDGRDDARKIREKVTGKLVTLDATLGPTLPAFLTLLDVAVEDLPWQALEPPQRRQRTLQAIKALLLRESQVQPVLLVCENLHWIDAETQAFLESLPTARMLLLVNSRPEYQHSWGQKSSYTQLRLDPLPQANAADLLDALLGEDTKLTPLKRLLITRTEGNPFFLEESVRTLGENGVLVGTPGAYRLAQVLASIQVPATVQAVLALRQGDLLRALPRLEQAVTLSQNTDLPFYCPRMAAALGAAYTLGGRVTDAVPLLTRALAQTTATGMVGDQALCRLALGEAHLLAGRLEEVHTLAERTLALAREHQERGNEVYALHLLGEIATRREPLEHDQAEAHYRQALALAEALGMRPLQAHCHRSLGNLYATIGHRAEACAELDTVIELYRAMAMAFWLPQAEAALARAEGQ
jgi:class 3 adenylate cyclase/tetratricopeptide (TPR) repeat protein